MRERLRQWWKRHEPWYNWGKYAAPTMDSVEDMDGFYFEFEWLGLAFQVTLSAHRRERPRSLEGFNGG